MVMLVRHREADTMKHKDISKIKRGDLWVRPPIPPAVVVKVNKKTIDFYLPENTEGHKNVRNVVENILDQLAIKPQFPCVDYLHRFPENLRIGIWR